MSHLHSGPEHAGSQTTPQYNPPLLKTESQLWSHNPPDAPECERSVLPLHTSVALCQEGPLTEYTAFRKCILTSVTQQETHIQQIISSTTSPISIKQDKPNLNNTTTNYSLQSDHKRVPQKHNMSYSENHGNQWGE